MQIAYQPDPTSGERANISNIGSLQSVSKGVVNNFRTAQQSVLPHKSQNEVYGNSRVFSPYQSPSTVVVADKIIQKGSFSPIFMHNAAITKAYFISKPAQPKDHAKINIVA